MNKNGGFDKDGNLYYGPISKVVLNFEYVGSVELLGKQKKKNLKYKLVNNKWIK